MTFAEIGPYFAELRTKFGLSLQDISDRLHIRPRYLNAIEIGKLDELPGAAYARGYVHSYAAFLGLDANQVVGLYFAPKVAAAQPSAAASPAAPALPAFTHALVAAVAPRAQPITQKWAEQWRGLAVAAVVAILVVLVIAQVFGAKSPEGNEQPTVTAVPEDMLASIRTGLMPTAQNYGCFAGYLWLSCLNASEAMQQILTPDLFVLRELNDDDLAELESIDATSAELDDEKENE